MRPDLPCFTRKSAGHAQLSEPLEPPWLHPWTKKLETFRQFDDRIAKLIEDPEELEHAILVAAPKIQYGKEIRQYGVRN